MDRWLDGVIPSCNYRGMQRKIRSASAPVPVLARVRPILRKRPLIKSPQAVVTRIRIGDALLGLAEEACGMLDEGRDRLGEMWETAHAFMDVRAQREIMRRNGSVMVDARVHMADAVRRLEDGESWDDPASGTPEKTVEDEIDAKLAMRWLEDRIAAMDHRTACIVRGCLALDGATEDLGDLAKRFSITTNRIRMILDAALADLHTAWRAGLREANLLLTYGEPEIPPPPGEPPVRVRIVAAPPEGRSSSRYFDRVRYDRGALLVAGLRIERVGHNAYRIDGEKLHDADGVASLILEAIGDDEGARKARRISISQRDTAISDAMRWQMVGTAWPTKVADRIFLPLRASVPADRMEAA